MKQASTQVRTAAAQPTSQVPGPVLCLAAAAIALVVTALAATAVPTLARHGTVGYDVSGFWMCLSDVLLLAAVLVFVREARAGAGGKLTTISSWLAVLGSAGAVLAEAVLRVSFSAGTAGFSVAGPLQALGFIGLGVGVVRGGVWGGWRRFTWLALGLYVPLVLVPALARSGGQNLAALAGFHGLVGLVGLAWLVEDRRAGS